MRRSFLIHHCNSTRCCDYFSAINLLIALFASFVQGIAQQEVALFCTFKFPAGHGPTNLAHWATAVDPYPVTYKTGCAGPHYKAHASNKKETVDEALCLVV